MKTVAFTGHRDRETDPAVFDTIPRGLWIHGGAIGFDRQVQDYAEAHGIEAVVIRPDYRRHGRRAPHVRNRQIVDAAEILIACYDGRTTGGTAFTVGYARRKGKPVRIVEAK
jgi:hypothetical protein